MTQPWRKVLHAQPQRHQHSTIAPRRSQSGHHQRQPHQHGMASMRSKYDGINSIFLPTCLFVVCINYIMLCKIKSMNHRASLHEPRNMSMTTKMKRWKLGGLEILKPECM